MAYVAVTFVADEILTSVKMNQIGANDASFNDGTGIGTAAIKAINIDFATFPTIEASDSPAVNITTTDANYLTVDLSAFPTGSKIFISANINASGSDLLTGMTGSISYNGAKVVELVQTNTWGRNMTPSAIITKIAGQDLAQILARKDNSSLIQLNTVRADAFRVG